MRAELEPVPSWVTDGWYANDQFAQRMAIARYRLPKTTPAERAAARAFKQAPAHPCASCGKHRFAKPGVTCFWCRRAPARALNRVESPTGRGRGQERSDG